MAPYVLTALITRPKRLVYMSSLLHQQGDPTLQDPLWKDRPWDGRQAYSDTKLHVVLLAFAIARHWPEVRSNAVEPGRVPTKMGGPQATDDLDAAHRTQVRLAVSDDPEATVSGEYFYHLKRRAPAPLTREKERQEKLLNVCKALSRVDLLAH